MSSDGVGSRSFGSDKQAENGKQESTAIEFKDQGNRFYALHKYEEAVACYSRAIVSLFVCCK